MKLKILNLLLVSVSAWTSFTCVGHAFKVGIRTWQPVASNHFRYEDRDMVLEFKATPDRQFHWRIKNKSQVPLKVAHRTFFLKRGSDPQPYSLWGQPKEMTDIPDIEILPGRFLELTYPVQYNSPLFPFNTDQAITLHLQVNWGFETETYQIVFPIEEKKQP